MSRVGTGHLDPTRPARNDMTREKACFFFCPSRTALAFFPDQVLQIGVYLFCFCCYCSKGVRSIFCAARTFLGTDYVLTDTRAHGQEKENTTTLPGGVTFRVATSTAPDPEGSTRFDMLTPPCTTAACAAG